MAIRVDVNVDNAAALLDPAAYGPGALLRLERASDEAGAYSEILTLLLVAGTDSYAFWDATGTSTSWYRSRVSSVSETSVSGYSDPFQFGELLAYAEVDDLLERLPKTTVERDRNLLADLLRDASAVIDAQTERDFYRHPQVSGTETRLFGHGGGSSALAIPAGIVSATLIEYATTTGGTYTSLAAVDWWISTVIDPGDTSYEVALRGIALGEWYPGFDVIRVTGVFGFARVPDIIRAGTLALARDMYALQATRPGQAPMGDLNEQGMPGLLPLTTTAAIKWGKARGPRPRRPVAQSVRMSTSA